MISPIQMALAYMILLSSLLGLEIIRYPMICWDCVTRLFYDTEVAVVSSEPSVVLLNNLSRHF